MIGRNGKNLYDESTQVLIAMNEDVMKLGERYGHNSKLFQTKMNQIQILIEMQSMALLELDGLRESVKKLDHAVKLAVINQKAWEIAARALIESMAAKIHTDEIMDYLILMNPNGKKQ